MIEYSDSKFIDSRKIYKNLISDLNIIQNSFSRTPYIHFLLAIEKVLKVIFGLKCLNERISPSLMNDKQALEIQLSISFLDLKKKAHLLFKKKVWGLFRNSCCCCVNRVRLGHNKQSQQYYGVSMAHPLSTLKCSDVGRTLWTTFLVQVECLFTLHGYCDIVFAFSISSFNGMVYLWFWKRRNALGFCTVSDSILIGVRRILWVSEMYILLPSRNLGML